MTNYACTAKLPDDLSGLTLYLSPEVSAALLERVKGMVERGEITPDGSEIVYTIPAEELKQCMLTLERRK